MTLSDTSLSIDQLNSLFSCKKLKKLIVIHNYFNIDELMQILCYAPNIQILILLRSSFSFLENKINNNIWQITIQQFVKLNHVQQLINTFPNLKSLEMKINEDELEFIIRFILKKNNE